jgi:hypothetical protein
LQKSSLSVRSITDAQGAQAATNGYPAAFAAWLKARFDEAGES